MGLLVYLVQTKYHLSESKFWVGAGCAKKEGAATLFNNAILRHVESVVQPTAVFTDCEAIAKAISQASIRAICVARAAASRVIIIGLSKGVLQLVKDDLGTITDRSGATEEVRFAVLVFEVQIVPPYDALVTAGKQEAENLQLFRYMVWLI